MTPKPLPGIDASTPIAPRAGHAHYQALDGLRGLAILLVFMVHVNGAAYSLRESLAGHVLALGAAWGWMGVDLFFVLSGFLITGILIKALNGPHYFRNFYIRRTLRIFPLFYGVLLLLAVLTPVLQLKWHPGHIAYLFYCQNIAVNMNPALTEVQPAVYIGHFWSLAVEEQYYLLWPMAIWLLRDERKMMRLCLALIAFTILLRFVLTALLPSNVALDIIYKELPTHWDGLLLGSWLTLAMRRWPVEQLRRHTRWPFWLAIAVLLLVGIYTRSMDFQSPAMETIGFTVIPVMFASLLLRCFVPGSPVLRFCSLRFMRFLGRYSYGIYVYHVMFWPLMVRGLHLLQAHLHPRAVAALVFVLLWALSSVGAAMLSYKYFESPFLRLKERFAPSLEPATNSSLEPAELVKETT
jgi:peptidoglycan/LPS O-acetylase OafA/YrhL